MAGDTNEPMLVDNSSNSSDSFSSSSGSTESNELPSAIRRSKRTRTNVMNYNLRDSSVVCRIQSERRRSLPRQPKPKTKPAPLSKYRRKSANKRERSRMQDMNEAFEALKNVVPDYATATDNSKITKITTLRLAVNYIAALRNILGYSDADTLPSSSYSGGSDMDSCQSPSSESAVSVIDDRRLSVSDELDDSLIKEDSFLS